jgi:2-amino-4-deoxychorismate synthase
VAGLLEARRPFLAVCLGHQVLSRQLGLDLAFKDIVFQGTQSRLTVLDRPETVGFYNTFVARVPDSVGQEGGLPEGVTVEADDGGDVHLLSGPHYRGVQFHAESILTQNGYAILRDLVTQLLD